MNKMIVSKIKQARIERSLTQKDIGRILEKTASAISDLERGKVQISASDLYKLSQYLNKPIEYFFGEEFISPDIQDLISIIRRLDPDTRKNIIPILKIIVQAQRISDEISMNSDFNETQLKSQAMEIYNLLIPYLVNLNDLLKKGFETKGKLEEILEISNSNTS